MKRNIFWLGMLVMILTFGMTVVGCGDGSTDNNGGNDPNNPNNPNPGENPNPGTDEDTYYYDKAKKELYLRAQSDNVAHTGGGLKLQDFFTEQLKTDTVYMVQLTGIVDIPLTNFYIDFYDINWVHLEGVGGSYYYGTLSDTFDKTFLLFNNTDLPANQIIVQFGNNVQLPNGTPLDGSIIATISNFSMTIVEKDISSLTIDPQLIGKWEDENSYIYNYSGKLGLEFTSTDYAETEYNIVSPDNGIKIEAFTFNNKLYHNRYSNGYYYLGYSITGDTLTIDNYRMWRNDGSESSESYNFVGKKVDKFSWE